MIVSYGLRVALVWLGSERPKGVAIELVPHFDCNAVREGLRKWEK